MFQVVFEGIIGNGYAGDMAIDDIQLTTNCPSKGNDTPYNWCY